MKRQYVILAVTLAALLGSLVTVYATIQERDFQLRGYVDASQDADLPFRVPRLGVNAELTQYTPANLQQQLNRMDAAHITWVRQVFAWDQIEPQPGQYEWSKWDAIVDAVDQHPNLHLVAVLMDTPAWGRDSHALQSRTSPPFDPKQFADFAGAFATRYGETIDYYQVWDEPNLTETWGGLEPRPVDYLALLQETYPAIHSSDHQAVVIAGALAPTTETGPKNISDMLYLHDLYTLGAKPYMDAIGAKPYGFSTSPEDRIVDANTLNFSRIIALREEMVRNQDASKSIWAMNWGWNSLPQNWSGRPSIWGSVSASEQVAFTLSALDRAEREWPWLGAMILEHWQPDVPLDDPMWGFALVDHDNTPTPLYNAFVNHPQPAVAENGLYSAVNPYTQYSGVWTFGNMGADIGWVQDSQFDFKFAGKSVSLLLRQDDYVAYLYPTIDGNPANATPHDTSGNAYIVLTSGSLSPEVHLVPVGRNLSNGLHTLHGVADRGWDRWAIAGYGVSSGDLAAPFVRQLLIAWVVVGVSTVSTLVAFRQIDWKLRPRLLDVFNERLTQAAQLFLSAFTSVALLIGMLLTFGDNTPHILRREAVQLGLAVLSAGIIYLEPGFILTIVSAMILLILIYNQLDIGLTLTIFWAPFFLFPIELYRFAFPMSEILILMTFFAWTIRILGVVGRWRQARSSQFPATSLLSLKSLNIIDYTVIAWVILGILSLLWAEYRPEAMTKLRVMIFEPAAFYLIFRTIVHDRKTVLRIVGAFLLSGCAVAAIGLSQFVQGDSIITAEDGARRLASVYGSPNNVGLFLGRCIPFALAFLVMPIKQRYRTLSFFILGILGVAVLLSQSVGAIFIGVPASIIVVLILALGKRARFIVLAFAILALVAFLFSLQSERFARVLEFDSGTNFYRIRVWQSAMNMIADHPITGLGLDQFLYAFRGQYIMPDAWQEPNLSHPHNLILDFWVNLGILGVAVLLSLLFGFWNQVKHILPAARQQDPILLAILIGAIGSMVNLISHGMIDNSVFVQDLCYIFVMLLALPLTLSNIGAIDEPSV